MNTRVWCMMAVLATAILLTASCSGNKDAAVEAPPPDTQTTDTRAVVKGAVHDRNGNHVADAAVKSQNSSTLAQTDSEGKFSIILEPGAHRLTVIKNNMVVLEQCLVVAEQVTYDLGDLDPSTTTNCDVVCTNGPDSFDRDCDALPNDVETAGWEVIITLGSGATETRHVSSNPDMKDTDGDGLTDAEEYAMRTDPGRIDTDGDLLSDYAEVMVYKSNPLVVDTDGDSRGPQGDKPSDPNLWDGYEVLVSHTSPVLADTDGDGMTDYEEIHSGGTNPLVADLPILALEVYGDPRLEVNTTIVSVCTKTSLNLTREAQERVNTDNVTTKMSIENTVKLHTEAEAGTGTWPPSFSAKLTTDSEFKQGYIHDTTANFTQTSVQEAQTMAACWDEHGTNFSNGRLSVAMKLRNQSSLTFKVKDIAILAYQVTTGSSFRLIGSLDPDGALPANGVLGPHGDISMTFKKTDIDAETTKALISNPAAMTFEIGGYSLFQLDDWGVNETVNFAKLGESVVQQTGLLTIDYGNGIIERRMIATNVNRKPDGSARGVTLKEALATILSVTYQTEVQKDSAGSVIGNKVLKKVKNVATYQNDPVKAGRGFWVVGGTSDAFAEGIDVDFDDIVLKSGERISLVFLKDTDLDGIFDNEEALLGTDKNSMDSDGDGLSDYEEAKIGWTVTVRNTSYRVYSDPRFVDVDGDYLNDAQERAFGTDPHKKNTDGDTLDDTNDPYPLSPPCLSGKLLGLAAWWNGSTVGSAPTMTALDVWSGATHSGTGDPGGYASSGPLSGTILSDSWKPPYDATPGLNAHFNFNTGTLVQHDQQIVVADSAALDPGRSLSPQAVTLSAWVYWNGNATGASWATILTKGPLPSASYSLLVGTDGAIKFRIFRSAHYKCFGWFFGWIDGLCADWDENRMEELLGPKVPLADWAHVTATFSPASELMKVYVDYNGTTTSTQGITNYAGSSPDYYTTNNLITNSDPLRIGLDAAPASSVWPFRGMLDDVQVYGRVMTPNEVTLFNDIGLCAP